jgi:hypothetical protein
MHTFECDEASECSHDHVAAGYTSIENHGIPVGPLADFQRFITDKKPYTGVSPDLDTNGCVLTHAYHF